MANTYRNNALLVLTALLFAAICTGSWPNIAISAELSPLSSPAGASSPSETKTLLIAAFKVVISLAAVIALMLVFVYLLKKAGFNKGMQSGSMVTVLESKMVAPKKYIAIVEVAGKTLSVGITDHNINLLTELDPEVVSELQSSQKSGSATQIPNKFATLLAKAARKEV